MDEKEKRAVPPGWAETTIENVTLPVAKVDLSANPAAAISYIDISSINNIRNVVIEAKRMLAREAPSRARQLIRSGDVLFATVRPYLRNIALVPGQYDGEVASTGFCVLRPAHGIDPKLLFFKCVSNDFVSSLTVEQYGVSYPAVKDDQVRSRRWLLPPQGEQRRIVAKIEELFSELDMGIENLTIAREQLKVYRQAVLKHAFDGKLTAQWRADNKDKLETFEQLSRTKCDALSDSYAVPDAWTWQRVSGVLLEGPSNGRSVKDRASGFPVLRLTALKNGKIDLAEVKNGDWDRDTALPFVVNEGDFLLSRGNGSKHLVGRGGIVPRHTGEVAFPDTIVRLKIDPAVIHAEFFSLLWNSRLVRSQIEASARTTAGIYKINQSHINNFKIPVPSLAEQARIICLLDENISVVDALEAELNVRLQQSFHLRQAILRKALSGQLVAQDPNDEPATALLERIREEKESINKKTKRKIAA